MHRIATTALALAVGLLVAPQFSAAENPQGKAGGPHKSEYTKLYNPGQVVTVRGTVENVTTMQPLEGMEEGVFVTMRTPRGQVVAVHLGPSWFIERQGDIVEQGDQIEIRGSRVTVRGQELVMASELRKQDMVLTLRDEQGMPVWNAWRSTSEMPQTQQERMEQMRQQQMERRQQQIQREQEQLQRQQRMQRQQEIEQREQELERQQQQLEQQRERLEQEREQLEQQQQ